MRWQCTTLTTWLRPVCLQALVPASHPVRACCHHGLSKASSRCASAMANVCLGTSAVRFTWHKRQSLKRQARLERVRIRLRDGPLHGLSTNGCECRQDMTSICLRAPLQRAELSCFSFAFGLRAPTPGWLAAALPTQYQHDVWQFMPACSSVNMHCCFIQNSCHCKQTLVTKLHEANLGRIRESTPCH